MKRTTILIYKDSTDPKKGLKEATQKEWSAILKSNKGLPMCKRRCFIEDSFEDCGVVDRMFIEVSYDAYKEWHIEDALKGKNMTAKKEYRLLSMDCQIKGSDGETLMDTLPSVVDIEGNILCEEEFRMAFPQLLLSLYARRLGVQVINDGEELTGLPLENYIPDLRIAIETAERQKEEAKVKGYICEKRGIRYVWVPLRRKDSLSEYAQRVKLALQKVHVYFPSDEEQDVELLRRLFDDWRRKAEIT